MSLTGSSYKAGFTLLEVLVVLMLLALISVAGISYIRPALQGAQTPVVMVEQAVARYRLLSRQRASVVRVPCLELAASGSSDIQVVQCFDSDQPVASVAFYPDGSMQLDALMVDVAGTVLAYELDWLSGRVRDGR